MSSGDNRNSLLRRVSQAMFWNASMLPLVSAVNLAAAVLIRRGFGLESGAYDVALGVLNTLLVHSGLGVPATVGQFVPSIERSGGRTDVSRFVRRVAELRFALLLAVLAPAQLFAADIGAYLHLGEAGPWLVRFVSLLAMLRAGADLAIKTLQALLAHLLANLVQLGQAAALVLAAAWTLSRGGSVSDLFAILSVLSALVVAGSVWTARRQLAAVPESTPGPARAVPGPQPAAVSQEPTGSVPAGQLWRFALFMYLFEAGHYFATPAFASPALAAASGGTSMVAVFNVAFQFPMTAVVVMLAGFQGLYRPLFATVIAEQSLDRIRVTFAEVSKVQAALLIPAGVGLAAMLPAYIPLFFGDAFIGAATLAQVLCAFLFLEALLNLGNILLSVDRRYMPVLATQALRVVGAPLFVWFAWRGQLVAAATALGAGRVLAVGLGFLVARRLYGVRFPVAFTTRVSVPALLMGATVMAGRWMLPATAWAAVALTALGVALTAVLMRWLRVLGPREIDLLERSALPGRSVFLRWLAR